MTNVLVNWYNFHEDWAREQLGELFCDKRALVLPLSFRDVQAWDDESWQKLFGKCGEKRDVIETPLRSLGVASVDWLNFFTADRQSAAKAVAQADVLFFTGGLPEKTVERLETLGLTDAVKNFCGIVVGASAGAMFQLDEYHITPDDDYAEFGMWRGLGLLGGFDVEVHYQATRLQKECIAKAKALHGKPIYALWHQGGLLVEGGVVQTLGKVEKF